MITLIIGNWKLKIFFAPVAQRIEHHIPNVGIQVRLLVGAQEHSSFENNRR